jgi:hypothetical protein
MKKSELRQIIKEEISKIIENKKETKIKRFHKNSELNTSNVSDSIEKEIKKLKDRDVWFNEEILRKNIEEFKDMDISELEMKTRNIQHYGSNIHYAAKILLSLKK